MKKLISILGLLVGVAAHGQGVHQSMSFLNARAVVVTNLLQMTNLVSITSLQSTNPAGTSFTNNAGVFTVVGGSTNSGINLLRTVNLWPPAVGTYVPIYSGTNDGVLAGPYNGSIFIRLKGQSGANSAVTFVFAPVPSDSGQDVTTAANLITVSVTANTTTEVQSLTPIDLSKVYSCKGLMLRTIVNGDTDATSAVTVTECKLVGFVP